MKQTIQVRPEQAKKILRLLATVRQAQQLLAEAVDVLLAGLVPDGAKLVAVEETGNVVVEVP